MILIKRDRQAVAHMQIVIDLLPTLERSLIIVSSIDTRLSFLFLHTTCSQSEIRCVCATNQTIVYRESLLSCAINLALPTSKDCGL